MISEMGSDGSFYFLVGTHRVADIFLGEEAVQTTLKLTQPRFVALQNFIKEEDRNNFAVLLLKGDYEVRLTKENPSIDIQQNNQIIPWLKDDLVDMVIFSKNSKLFPIKT